MRTHFILAVAIATIPLAACGGGNDTASPRPSVVATAPADVAAATADVKKNWSDFFSASVPYSQKNALLEDSASLQEALALSEKNPLSKQTESAVTAVTFTSATAATVTYDLSLYKNKVITGGEGTAVLDDGSWKVSKFTFCQLQKLGAKDKPVPGCV